MIIRGSFTDQCVLLSYIAPDKRVPANLPLRKVRELVRDVLSDLNRSLGRLYASDDAVWDPTTFTKNRERLQNGDVFTKFMTRLLNHPQVKPLLSDEHFSVDGTLIEAW